jgi:hypothetical protein
MNESDFAGSEYFPWEDVLAARNNSDLQRKHRQDKRTGYSTIAKDCPNCGSRPETLAWFYFSSPDDTWQHLCGRAGWMTVCDRCRRQVDFFMELMN